MTKPDRTAALALPAILLIGSGVAFAGSQSGTQAFGVPIFALGVAVAFILQWLAFVPAYLMRTERFFDLIGSLTFIIVTWFGTMLGPVPDTRTVLLTALVTIWAIRLGTFLTLRIQKAGKDARFDDLKTSLPRFLMAWTLQGLWVSLTIAAALAAITTTVRKELDLMAIIGLLVWIIGFGVETVADEQKRRFRLHPRNRDRFIDTGLWARSRHPNYFGEIVLWLGIAIIALPVLQGWQLATLISPVFVLVLLTRISGVPILEARADETWGDDKDFESYKRRTRVLIPW